MDLDDLIYKQEKAHTGRVARKKGLNFQPEVAKQMTEAFGTKFLSTSQSGSWATRNKRPEHSGDIVCVADDCWHIECKYHSKINLGTLFTNKCEVFNLWYETKKQCPSKKIPILIIKKNINNIIVVMEYPTYLCLSFNCLYKNKDIGIVVYKYNEFLKSNLIKWVRV